MQDILIFLKTNYQMIIYLTLFLIEILIVLIKKPIKVDSTKEKILHLLPLYISYAERLFTDSKSGPQKLELVVRSIKQFLSLKGDEFDSYIISETERILSTPTKKLEKGE